MSVNAECQLPRSGRAGATPGVLTAGADPPAGQLDGATLSLVLEACAPSALAVSLQVRARSLSEG